MKLSISEALQKLAQSEIRMMSIESDKVGGINLSQGICDLETPKVVLDGAKEAIDSGLNYYTRYDGMAELRSALSEKLRSYNKIDADPERNIIVSGGATGALFSACLALLRPGDEVLLFEPYYSYHLHTLLAIGVQPVYVRTNPPAWSFDLDEVEKAITPKTRAILISTPSNPSGKVFTKSELRGLAEICNRHDLLVFTDEIYEYFVYDGAEHVSPASLPELRDRTITVSGYSKTFSITGWRVGYSVCKEEWASLIGQVNDLLYVCAPAPLQFGVAQGIRKLPHSFYQSIRETYGKKRDGLCNVLQEIGLTPFVPQGAYYVLADVSPINGSGSKEKAMTILRDFGVAGVPGRAFYHDSSGEDFIRFCFAKKDKDLDEAYLRLGKIESGHYGKKI